MRFFLEFTFFCSRLFLRDRKQAITPSMIPHPEQKGSSDSDSFSLYFQSDIVPLTFLNYYIEYKIKNIKEYLLYLIILEIY